jgi:hypothetical protein
MDSLSRLIERTVAIESLPGDLSLVSSLNGDSRLPIRSLIHHRSFLPYRPTEATIIAACAQSSTLGSRLIWCPHACLILPFHVDPTVLIIGNTPDVKMNEFRTFLTRILGHGWFEIHPNHQPHSFRTRYADVATALCVWRALQYCPLHGHHTTSTVFASLLPLEPNRPVNPKGVHKKRSQTGERCRSGQNRKNLPKNVPTLPAVMPAGLGRGLGELPQAVLIEMMGLKGAG